MLCLDDPLDTLLGCLEDARNELDNATRRAFITSPACRKLTKNFIDKKLSRPLDRERLLLMTQ